MQKMQVFFPEPQLKKLRQLSKQKDRPVSELIRLAVDYWLEKQGEQQDLSVKETPPEFSCGNVRIPSDGFREMAYDTSVNHEHE